MRLAAGQLGDRVRNLSDAGTRTPAGDVQGAPRREPEAPGDRLIIRQFTVDENKDLATTYGPDGGLSKDGQQGVIAYATDTRNNDLWAYDFNEFRKTGEVKRIPIMVGDKSENTAAIAGDTMFLKTTNKASERADSRDRPQEPGQGELEGDRCRRVRTG